MGGRAIAVVGLGVGPQQRYRVVGRIVLKHHGKRAATVAEAEVLLATDVGMSRAENGVVIAVGQHGKIGMSCPVDWQVGGEQHAE